MKEHDLMKYVRWRGDLSFGKDPFNEVDNVILCELSYVDFTPALGNDGKTEKSLRECGRDIMEKGEYVLRTLDGGQEDLFLAIFESRRFGDLTVRKYLQVTNESETVQFSAVEFVIDLRTSYIAFRGTDNSLVGWKEDFMMSFSLIPGQEYAKEYLREVMRPFRKYYVGGHSKGGNLAMYACASLPKKYQNRILHLYNNDGPGFSPDYMDITLLEPYASRMTRLIPAFCVVGRIFELPYGTTKIICSEVNGVGQHDLVHWKALGAEMVKAEKNEDVSEWIISSVNSWVGNIPDQERESFVNEVFEILSAGGAKTVQEVTGKGLTKVLSAASNTSKGSLRLVRELAQTLLRNGRPWENPAEKGQE